MQAKTISIPSVKERREALENRFQTWSRETLATHFEKMCHRFSERDFIFIEDKGITYGDTWKRSLKYAKALLNLGVKNRDHLAVLMENDLDYTPLMIASAMVGVVFIPVNTMLKREELSYVLSQSDSKFLIFHQQIKRNNYSEIVGDLLSSEEFLEKSILEKVVCAPNKEIAIPEAFISWTDFVKGADQVSDNELAAVRKTTFYPDEVAIIMYTSGSTGQSKGVMLTHDMLLRGTYATCLSRAIEDGRTTFAALPFYHCFNIIEGIFAMSFVGGKLVAPNLFTPLSALQLMEKYRANDFLCVPSMLIPFLNQPNIADFDLEALYAVWCGAAPAPVTVWEKATKLLGLKEICTGYGQTEVSSSGVITEMGDPIERITTRVGRPKLGGIAGLPEFGNSIVQYRTVDTETGEFLPEGEIGELVVRGNTVTHGYYKKPMETAETIDKDGWLKTGDVGRIDADGYIEMLGRSKELYKVSGELVAPKEIESLINRYNPVNQACVVGVPNEITTEAGAVFIELKPGKTCTVNEIIELCKENLARFKVPRHVWFIQPDEWPMTSTGKIQKMRLKEMALERVRG